MSDTDSLRAESIGSTFPMAQGPSKLKRYAAWIVCVLAVIVCVLAAAVAYAVFDSGIFRLEHKNSANLTITDPVDCCPGGQMVDCSDDGLCQTPAVKLCFHKASKKMNHAEAMEYCETTPGYMPLLLKTKTELINMATQFPDTSDIWIPFDPKPGSSMEDCNGLSCNGEYMWPDGTLYNYNSPDVIRLVKDEPHPCFRLHMWLTTGDEPVLADKRCSNSFAAVCAYHC